MCSFSLSFLSVSSMVQEFKREMRLTSRLHAADFFLQLSPVSLPSAFRRRIGFIQKVSAFHFSSRVLSTLLPPLLWSSTCEFNNVETAGGLAEKERASARVIYQYFQQTISFECTFEFYEYLDMSMFKTLLGISSLELARDPPRSRQ